MATLLENLESLKMRAALGIITTTNRTDHHLANNIDFIIAQIKQEMESLQNLRSYLDQLEKENRKLNHLVNEMQSGGKKV